MSRCFTTSKTASEIKNKCLTYEDMDPSLQPFYEKDGCACSPEMDNKLTVFNESQRVFISYSKDSSVNVYVA